MPHLANGRAAKLGEAVICAPKNSEMASIGIIVAIQEGQSCNASLLTSLRRWNRAGGFYPVQTPYPDCVSLDECHPIEA